MNVKSVALYLSVGLFVCQEQDGKLTVAVVCGVFAVIAMVTVIGLVIISKSPSQSYTLRSGESLHS